MTVLYHPTASHPALNPTINSRSAISLDCNGNGNSTHSPCLNGRRTPVANGSSNGINGANGANGARANAAHTANGNVKGNGDGNGNGNGNGAHQEPPWPWRRLVRFVSPDGRELLGEPVDELLDIGLAVAKGLTVLVDVLDATSPWDPKAEKTGEKVEVVRLLAPISPSECGTIRATGLNYTDHARELNMAIPTVPELFFKPSQCLADPGEAIPIPPCAQNGEMDYEVELAIVIGRACRNVSTSEATQYVLGWTCANDLTARNLQKQCSQWGFSKGFDKFCPLGPVLVSTTSLPDPADVTLQTRVNGQLVQSGSAQNMIWHVSEIVAYLSQGSTLPPGTVIITGTPPGIGASRGSWLRDGDEVRCTISHGIGTLVNEIVYD